MVTSAACRETPAAKATAAASRPEPVSEQPNRVGFDIGDCAFPTGAFDDGKAQPRRGHTSAGQVLAFAENYVGNPFFRLERGKNVKLWVTFRQRRVAEFLDSAG